MTLFRRLLSVAAVVSLLTGAKTAGAATDADELAEKAAAPRLPPWVLSSNVMRVGKDQAIGLKLDRYRAMWVGGKTEDPAESNTCFIYDTRTRTFRETSPMPSAKSLNWLATAGVLPDGTVVVAGGELAAGTGALNAGNRLSYRYDPRTDRWNRTGDLPEAQQWAFTPATLLHDGRLIVAGGLGLDGRAGGIASRNAFVYNPKQTSTVDVVDPETGTETGERAVVRGKWDFTRKADGTVSKLHSGHLFGNAALLKDGRVFVGGGHKIWDYADTDVSELARYTDFFDPATGVWSRGAPFPNVAGEDDRKENSRGGRANGVGFAVLGNGKVVIAGGYTASENEKFFTTWISRQSILVMTPAKRPMQSRYRLATHRIPPGTGSGGLFGDNGRGHVLTYAIARNRVVIAGGQNNRGEDLFDTYVFDEQDSSLARGPDMVHEAAQWAAEAGYPEGYQTPKVSTRAVSMNNSKLVFDHHVLVHGGGFNGPDALSLFNQYAEQLMIH